MKTIAALALALLTAVGCATEPSDDPTTDDTTEAAQDVQLASGPTHSFSSSCTGARWDVNSQVIQAIVSASATGCRRPDGSFSGPQHWSGQCFRDVSNCNGRIVCQTHCP